MVLSTRQCGAFAGLRQELEGGQRRPMFIDSSCTCIPRKCKSTTLIPGPEATKEQKRQYRLRAAMRRPLAAIRIAHVGPPRGAIRLFGRILMSCTYSHLVARSDGAPKNSATPSERAQWSRRSCRRSVAYLPMRSAEMCGMSLSGPALTASTSARNASVGAAAPRIGLLGLRKACNRGRTEC
jgi:hypothetical protein